MPTLALSFIRTDGGTQTRAAISKETVSDYADAVEAGARLPAVTVFHDGSDYWLADGFHRYEAAKKLGAVEIEADVKQGARRDAVLHSVGANATHGLRRTTEDKRRAVTVLLEDAEWSQWSDREISRRAGVSPSTVGALRPKLSVQVGQMERKVKRGDSEYIMQVLPKPAEPLPPRYIKTYSPPPLPDPEEDEVPWDEPLELEAPAEVLQRTNNLEHAELVAAEIAVSAAKPLPEETPYTRIQSHMQTEAYQRVEFLRKHIPPLAQLPEGQLAEDLQLPDSVALGLPRLFRHILKEAAT